MNFSAIMQLKKEWDGFQLRHPKFPSFLSAAQQKGIQEGTVIEIQITAPDGTTLHSNLKVQAADLDMFHTIKNVVS